MRVLHESSKLIWLSAHYIVNCNMVSLYITIYCQAVFILLSVEERVHYKK